ncbi:MAG: hypothetical protein GXP43_02875, partial [bacterium]|nr:hypothetical protein [bacterium]
MRRRIWQVKGFIGWVGLWLVISPWVWSSARGLSDAILLGIFLAVAGSWWLVNFRVDKQRDVFLWLGMTAWLGVGVVTAMDKWVALWWWLVYGLMGVIYVSVKGWARQASKEEIMQFMWGVFSAYFIIFILVAWASLVGVYQL